MNVDEGLVMGAYLKMMLEIEDEQISIPVASDEQHPWIEDCSRACLRRNSCFFNLRREKRERREFLGFEFAGKRMLHTV